MRPIEEAFVTWARRNKYPCSEPQTFDEIWSLVRLDLELQGKGEAIKAVEAEFERREINYEDVPGEVRWKLQKWDIDRIPSLQRIALLPTGLASYSLDHEVTDRVLIYHGPPLSRSATYAERKKNGTCLAPGTNPP